MNRLLGKILVRMVYERIDKVLGINFRPLVEIVSTKVVTPAPVKAVEETCVTCGGAHSWYNCPTTDNNQASVCATTGTYNQVNPPNRVSNQMAQPGVLLRCKTMSNRFAPMIRNLLMNKEKLLELAKIPLNENCSAMLLKKLPKKLGDPGKFLILCNFSGMDLADRSITYPKGLAEDVFVKVGKFHFPTDFVVVDFEADPRVPLILGRSFLRTGRALIDVYGEEITLRVDNEAVTFNLDQTTRYSSTNDKSVNRIDIIDAVCEEYAPELLGFSNSSGGNPTPTSEPFTSEFILEEIEAYLKDDSISPEIDHADCDPEGDICLIEKLLNNDPFQLPSMDLKQSEVTEAKSSIKEPPELELKDLPSHLEYDFLEENDKLPVIIAKGLNDDEKEALLKVLKSHKRAIAWKITDIKGIDPRFCTHKILMEDDYKPTIQSQRRVNQNSRVHYVPKKGGITVVANEENELIPTPMEVSTNIEEGYYDSKGDVIFLENLLSDDTTHNLSPEVFFNHEPQHDTFSPKSDPLHHEFTGELITLPPRIVREHEDYISRMWMLCGIESDFDSEEDIIDNLLNDDPIPEYERLTFDMEPDVPVINNVDELNEDECFDPGGGEINVESLTIPFTLLLELFFPYLEVSPLLSSTKNEDNIFDPDIST
ncbi:reverse transcriptase domain-containing protein [Tanacetum coccineum]